MFRSILMLGVFAIVGVFAFKVILGTAVGLLFFLISFAIKALIVGLVLYFIVSIFSPDTMRRWKERWSRP
ncbi:MAG: hypothetical protein HOQ11_10170 [Gemmatimonadaceae bacterium]|nr:hypothetical protein [Gemmatimonadaceae bacterium]NUQ94486.1 hypothetical protein [Gemmatimonadaceae bacterium]NUR19335.1 hypothetical protein [Gemmatimonadaceae bacterium]NUS97756.1 hypothetical protein [Gemmatimonadaceae bacterium]